jgi:hypothetical protein
MTESESPNPSKGPGIPKGKHPSGVRLLALLAGLWLLVAIPFLTDPACNMFIGVYLTVTLLGLGLGWLCIPILFPASLRSRAGLFLYLSSACPVILGLVLAFTDIGLKVRVAACEPWLTADAANAPLTPSGVYYEYRLVGLFLVERTEEREGIVFLYTGASFLNPQGLAYNPTGKPWPSSMETHHLYGPWYSFELHW